MPNKKPIELFRLLDGDGTIVYQPGKHMLQEANLVFIANTLKSHFKGTRLYYRDDDDPRNPKNKGVPHGTARKEKE